MKVRVKYTLTLYPGKGLQEEILEVKPPEERQGAPQVRTDTPEHFGQDILKWYNFTIINPKDSLREFVSVEVVEDGTDSGDVTKKGE